MVDSHRAVICGAGAAGMMHALVLRAAGVVIAGVFDPDTSRARAVAEMHGADVVEREDELWARDANIACITSPPPRHAAQAERAAAAWRSARPSGSRVIFVEKPLAVTRAELGRLAEVPGCVPVVQWRAGRALRAVRAAIACGELGAAPSVSVDLAWSRDDAYFAAGRGTREAWGCGVLLSVGIHAIDAVCWAIGRRVSAAHGLTGTMRAGQRDIETRAAMLLAYEGGALAAVRATFEAGPDTTTLTFAGGGVTATIAGGELDPTASEIAWSCEDEPKRARLSALERGASGAVAAPLLVPFLHDAIAAFSRGAEVGACDALPDVRTTLGAHAAILDVYGR